MCGTYVDCISNYIQQWRYVCLYRFKYYFGIEFKIAMSNMFSHPNNGSLRNIREIRCKKNR